MDGMSPHDEQPALQCPHCGTSVSAQARFCGACGSEMNAKQPTPTAASASAPPESVTEEPASPVTPATEAAQQPQQVAKGGNLCAWCGTDNEADAKLCAACGAMFPTPEMDAVVERAARERIQDMESEIAKGRGGSSWWPFHRR